MIILLCVLVQCCLVFCDFVFPELTLEAFEPEGFRASIPEMENVRMFGFHGNRNRDLTQIEPGEFNKDILNPKSNGWSYFNPNLKLKVGDKVHYWAFLQIGNLGYKKDAQVWEVKELVPLRKLNSTPCLSTITEILGPTQICKKQLIFDSTFFDNKIDESKWKRAHFIPAEPDFEFCSYQRRNDTCYVSDSKLIIKPIPFTKEEEVTGILDMRDGCTSHYETQCYVFYDSGFILPPVVSAKMKTYKNFKYGTVEVRAKLPAGDWLYPEIYLEAATLEPFRRIWIGYARGNERLVGNGENDLGGALLFGGPIVNTSEPDRSKYLSSIRWNNTLSSEFHTYTVVWEPSKITLLVDNVQYGEIKNDIASLFDESMHLVLGVGVGGIIDFPDHYVSSNNKRKPWTNADRLPLRKFFNARQDWLPTWKKEDSALIVEYARIWAL